MKDIKATFKQPYKFIYRADTEIARKLPDVCTCVKKRRTQKITLLSVVATQRFSMLTFFEI